MPMRRAIVHIGMPRTASTTIQHVLARLRAPLLQAGILYPGLTPRSMADEPHISHQHLGETLDGRRPRSERRELMQQLDDALAHTAADTVLLSYEDWAQEKRAGAIATTLQHALRRRGFNMEAIVVVKPQAELLNSIYAHRLQLMREKRPFEPFARGFERSARFGYDSLVAPWSAACDGRLQAIPLRDARDTAPLLHRFFAATGLADRTAPLLAADDPGRVENRSPGPLAAEISRRLRLARVHARLRVRPRAMMREVERAAFAAGFDQIPFKGASPERRARMDALHAPANARFATAVWGRAWTDIVAPEPEHPTNELATRPIEPGTEHALQTILHDTCRQFGVTPTPPRLAWATEAAADTAALVQRAFRISQWRVV